MATELYSTKQAFCLARGFTWYYNEASPLPKEKWQIARLKWIPTDDEDANNATKGKRGYFQGAYIVPRTSWFSIVSLKDEWVTNEFDKKLLKEVIYQGVHGVSQSKKFIPIPPGSTKNQPLPPGKLLHYLRKSQFQQGANSTCLLDCLCSAVFDFGCVEPVEEMRKSPGCLALNQTNTRIWTDLGNIVNRNFTTVGLKLVCDKQSHSVLDLLGLDDSFVIVATLRASDGMAGQHAVAVYNNGIYDANCPFVMKKTQESLDWCCGDGDVTCVGIDRSFRLLPARYPSLTTDLRFIVQTRNKNDCTVRGWVAGTKSNRDKTKFFYLLQFADGDSRYVTKDELEMYPRIG